MSTSGTKRAASDVPPQSPRGFDVLRNPSLNRGTGFTEKERDALGLRGLLPAHVLSQNEQAERILINLRKLSDPLQKFVALNSLHDRNESLFFRVLCDNIDEMQPLVYTPTVGLACQQFGQIFQRPRGMFIGANDRGRIAQVLRNWPCRAGMIVVTDGERILGLGDLGANGMGIPVGKLSLYTACAGIPPEQCLPVMLDVGTNNRALLADPLYLGVSRHRANGVAYDGLVDEFIGAARQVFPRACVQFEDFGNANAFRLLHKYREQICTFNDDIQGTASVALAGLYSAQRLTDRPLKAQKFLFLGAGEAGIGIGDLLVEALKAEGVPEDAARRQCWFVDSKGLVVRSRTDLVEHKQRFAHEHAPIGTLREAIETLRPTALIGCSGATGGFDEQSIRAMARLNQRPVIFALSNPTSKAECTAEQAYMWTDGRAIFASGSPFPPVTLDGRTLVPGQGNNSYIFPGVGLGVIASESAHVTDEMFFVAAQTLAGLVTKADLARGRVYPELKRIREVSLALALAVAEVVFRRGLAGVPRPPDLAAHLRAQMYQPKYPEYV